MLNPGREFLFTHLLNYWSRVCARMLNRREQFGFMQRGMRMEDGTNPIPERYIHAHSRAHKHIQMSFVFYLPAFVQFSNARAMQVLNRSKFTSEKRYHLFAIIIVQYVA